MLFFLIIFNLVYSQTQKQDIEYIIKFAETAVEEMYKYNIPASIKLGQALVETSGGQSKLAKDANNHFGIKCKNIWKGSKYFYSDDEYMECFRKYSSPKESYRDHSIFLTTRKNYLFLFTFLLTDYKSWAYGLKKSGYATNPNYPKMLIDKIEKYKLYQFDKIKLKELNFKLIKIYLQYFNMI